MIKFFVFDFDGTLVDSQDVLLDIYNQLAGKYKANKIDPKDFEYIKGLSIAERCKFLNFKLYKFPLMALDVYKLYRQSIKDISFFDGIKELLETLNARGFQIAIISTNSASNIRDFLRRNQIDFINEVICSNKIYGKERDIKRFLKMKKLKVSEVIYVGDEIRDIIASKKMVSK